MRRWLAAVVMCVAATGVARADDARFPSKPWALGQWARYERHIPGQRVAIMTLSAVALDACGLWIELDVELKLRRSQQVDHTLACVKVGAAPPATRAEARERVRSTLVWRDDQRAAAGTEAHEAEVADLLAPSALFDGKPDVKVTLEDVTTVAGPFADASHVVTADSEAWLSGAVPFGGVVLLRDGSRDRGLTLLAYGDGGGDSVISQLARSPRRRARGDEVSPPEPRVYYELSGGPGGLGGHRGEDTVSAAGIYVRAGVRLRPQLDLVLEQGGLTDAAYTPDSTLTQSTFVIDAGVRWSPWRSIAARTWGFDGEALRSVYGELETGYVELNRKAMSDSSTVARGVDVGAALGMTLLHAHDWSVGLAVEDHLALFDRGEGVRDSVAIVAVLRLYLPFF